MNLPTEAAVLAALRKRFGAPTYALLDHVRNGTGFDRKVTRTADAIAMSLWPSRGLELHGFEIKVSRQDLVKELVDPAKAEEICRFCDRWWLVVGSDKIVQPGELPPTWGLLVPRGDGLVVKVEAPKLEAAPVDRLFLAALLRKTTEISADERWLKQQVDERVAKEKQDWADGAAREAENAKRDLRRLQDQLAAFEKSSGVKINSYAGKQIGQAVAAVLRGDHIHHERRLLDLKASADAIAKRIGDELAKLHVQPAEEAA